MKVTRAGTGARIRLNLPESHVLQQLLEQLQDVIDPGSLEATDPVRERLYPAAYADADAAAEFREITEAGLQEERSARLDQCLGELLAGRSLMRAELTLDADATERWLRVLNDLRLAFGTRLGITEEDDNSLDESDPQVGLRARYLWLTALQDQLVTAVMG